MRSNFHIWTEEETMYLVSHYNVSSLEDLAQLFCVSTGAIKARISRLKSKGIISPDEDAIKGGGARGYHRSAILALPQKLKEVIVKREDFDGTGIPELISQYQKGLDVNF